MNHWLKFASTLTTRTLRSTATCDLVWTHEDDAFTSSSRR